MVCTSASAETDDTNLVTVVEHPLSAGKGGMDLEVLVRCLVRELAPSGLLHVSLCLRAPCA